MVLGDEILRLHQWLDAEARTTSKPFVSGWNTVHPFGEEYLPRESLHSVFGDANICSYSFLADSPEITSLIQRFHQSKDHLNYPERAIFASSGSSPLLLSFFLLLHSRNVAKLYYVPPIYYACYYFAKMLGIELIPLTKCTLNRAEIPLALPNEATAVILSDPIWVLGVPVHSDYIEMIGEWQERTGSLVFIDGTFQYTRWPEGPQCEESYQLNSDLTFRLVCPTKSLALNGVRFAYLLLPPRFWEDIRYSCSNVTGATGGVNGPFAVSLLTALNASLGNGKLVEYIKDQHASLLRMGALLEEAEHPSASYFTFARLSAGLSNKALVMDQRFFGLSGLEGFARINLLHPCWKEFQDEQVGGQSI